MGTDERSGRRLGRGKCETDRFHTYNRLGCGKEIQAPMHLHMIQPAPAYLN